MILIYKLLLRARTKLGEEMHLTVLSRGLKPQARGVERQLLVHTD